jgi:hypothetical protein
MEARGLIRRLSVGALILLQAEWLDACAAALIRAAGDDPAGLGDLAEDDVRSGTLAVPPEELPSAREHGDLLRIATVEDLLRHEIALRAEVAGPARLVFPSQVTRPLAGAPEPTGRAATFLFEGAVPLVYASLVVRLSRSGACARTALGRDAALFAAPGGGTCALAVREVEEALGELTVAFDAGASPAARAPVVAFIHAHLQRRSLPDRIRRLPTCPRCRVVLTDALAQQESPGPGPGPLRCPGCGLESAPPGPEESAEAQAAAVAAMDQAADEGRRRAVLASIQQARVAIGDLDVFLCYNPQDRAAARTLGDRLRTAGFLTWAGVGDRPRPEALEATLAQVRAAVLCLGPNGISREQKIEMAALVNVAGRRDLPMIAVILAEAPRNVRPPAFLGNREWIDFRQKTPDPFAKLVAWLTPLPKKAGPG